MTKCLVPHTPNLPVSVDLPLYLSPERLLRGPWGSPVARRAPGSAGHDLTMFAVEKVTHAE